MMNISSLTDSWLIWPLIIWTAFWKGFALWTAAKNNHKKWFVILVILNTVGILEIIYVFFVAKKKWSDIEGALKRLFSAK